MGVIWFKHDIRIGDALLEAIGADLTINADSVTASGKLEAACLILRRISQVSQPTPALGEICLWHDTAGDECFIVFNDPDEGVVAVPMNC